MTHKAVSERRMAPRVPVEGRVHGARVPEAGGISVLDISLEGLAIRVEQEVREGATLHLRLWSDACPPIVVQGKVVHAMRVTDAQNGARYFAGVEFVKEGALTTPNAIQGLIQSVGGSTTPIPE